ncbi:hypothetical protein TL16_g01066 [Triparma laevis f. inornata]|uniref:Bromo domain-containing protein n=1 Tax=Triparma laevis f. inornata TaxID=1714386 RepID=A0A9W7DUZ9_9STRA|nr:hypothetical protein TL16_g01066 [Triparma laevis f. inornata]
MAGGSKSSSKKANGRSNGKANGNSKAKTPGGKKKNSPKNKITNWLVSSTSSKKKDGTKEAGGKRDDVRVSPRRQLLKEEGEEEEEEEEDEEDEEDEEEDQEEEEEEEEEDDDEEEEEEEYPPGSRQMKLENNINHQGSTLSPAQVMLLDLLRRVRRKGDMYGFFGKPVDPVLDDCEDYHDVVPKDEAMDLSTLEKRIRGGECSDLNTFENQIKKIVANAKAYNADPEHTVHIESKVLEENAMPMIEAMRWKFNKKGAGGYDDHDEPSETTTSFGSSKKTSKREKKRVSYDESDSRFWDSMGEKMSPNAKIRKKNALIANPNLNLNPNSKTKQSQQMYPPPPCSLPHLSCDRQLKNSQTDYCHDRSKWLTWVEDMVTVCNEAARRRTLVTTSGRALRYDKPLSDDYIKERLELDDPLFGFTVRDKPSKEMQGFIVTTNFTVWRESFRFDTNIPQAGITQADRKEHLCDDGTFTDELSEVKRSGDKKGSGIVFNRVAEIGLLGGLGCGAALVEKAISHLESTKKYDYLVLQATKMAIPFYERCGFIRIGAVAKFNDNPNMPYVSYRHWSDIVAGTAVEASYMMGMRLGEKKKENEQNMKNQAKQQQRQPTMKLTPKTEKRKELEKQVADREKAMEIAKSLILQAINTNCNEDGGGSAFKELVALAKQQAGEAEDPVMERALDKAYTIFKSSIVETVMEAKDLLRESIGLETVHDIVPRTKSFNVTPIFFPKPNALTAQVPSNTMIFGMPPVETLRFPGIVHRRDEEFLGWQEGPFLRDMRVRVKAGGGEIGARKEAESPRKNSRSIGGEHLSGYRLRFDTVENMRKITKNTVRPLGRLVTVEDRVPIDNAVAIGLHSLLDKVELQSGDAIMYRFDGFHGWLEGIIERACKKGEAPAGAVVEESFIVKFDDGRRLAVVLSDVGGNRGVGRTWCTFNEWAGFSVLPLDILDACLKNQEVHFDSLVGGHSVGTVVDRIGGGLQGQIMWVVETDLTEKGSKARSIDPNNVLTQHFTTAELRYLVRVDDLGTAQQRSVLDRPKYTDFELTSHQKAMFGMFDGEEEEEDRKAKRKRIREESEDRIVVEVSTSFYLYGRERTDVDRKRALQRYKEIETLGAAVVMEGTSEEEEEEEEEADAEEESESEGEEMDIEEGEGEGEEEEEELEDDHEVQQRPAKKARSSGGAGKKVATPEKRSHKKKVETPVKKAATPEKRSHKKKVNSPAKKPATPEKRSHKKKVDTPEKRLHKKKVDTPEKRSHKKKVDTPQTVEKRTQPGRAGKSNGGGEQNNNIKKKASGKRKR